MYNIYITIQNLLQDIVGDILDAGDGVVFDDVAFDEELVAEVGGVVMDIEGVAHRAFLQFDGHAGVLRGDGCLAGDCQVGRGDRVLLERAGAAYDVPIDPDAGGAEQASGL